MARAIADPSSSIRAIAVTRMSDASHQEVEDFLAVEEPLEIRAGRADAASSTYRSVSVTMRTPGDDASLAAGFLFGEGLVDRPDDIRGIEPCGTDGNTVAVSLANRVAGRLESLSRNFYATSSCGVCGKASIEALAVERLWEISPERPKLDRRKVSTYPDLLRSRQEIFDETGGLHAAGLIDEEGRLLDATEDVGRHNALDKLIGRSFLQGRLPLDGHSIVVSGRLSFELVQKSVRAAAGALIGVSAPSSLAVDLARSAGLTLIGFARGSSYNVYSGERRLVTRS